MPARWAGNAESSPRPSNAGGSWERDVKNLQNHPQRSDPSVGWPEGATAAAAGPPGLVAPDRIEAYVVDDDPNDVTVATRALARSPFSGRVRVMRDANELLEFLGRSDPRTGARPAPRLIVLDLRMPGMDGRAALRALRSDARTRHVPVVIVSWSAREQDQRECYALGANSFVLKRADPSQPGQYLIDTMRYWLDTNRPCPS